MKKSITKFATLVALVLIISSCVKRNYYELTTDDYSWVNTYTPGQIIKFTDTAGVEIKYSIYNETRGYAEEGNNFYGVADYNFRSALDSIVGYGGVYIKRNETGLIAQMYWPRHPIRFELETATPVKDTINGNPLTDVYISEASASQMTTKENIIKVYYSKSVGFIRYQEYGGRVWTLKP
jgi:hypothetical protein